MAGTAPDTPLVALLSGPNLELLGVRQPSMYGTDRLADHVARAGRAAERCGARLSHSSHASEGDLVLAVTGARGQAAALVVNAGALTHYGWSLADALAAFDGPKIELHLSHPEAREPWRHTSVLAPVVDGTVAGLGGLGYEIAVEAACRLLSERAAGGAGEGAAGERLRDA
ncbi:MAG: type II 3-dehydroquinate dehydratase [Acidimicrobiales bacterium]